MRSARVNKHKKRETGGVKGGSGTGVGRHSSKVVVVAGDAAAAATADDVAGNLL